MPYDTIASEETVTKTKVALEQNGFTVLVAENGEDAKQKALQLLPAGAEVFTMTSVTLDSISLASEINESGTYDAVRPKFMAWMKDPEKAREMKRLGSAPEYALGSVHAVTEDGKLMIASYSGSQLGAYAYGADHVIWIVGTQKIVENMDSGFKRIYEYALPLESDRAKKAYGMPSSGVNKLLIINKEITPSRATVMLVKEKLGF